MVELHHRVAHCLWIEPQPSMRIDTDKHIQAAQQSLPPQTMEPRKRRIQP